MKAGAKWAAVLLVVVLLIGLLPTGYAESAGAMVATVTVEPVYDAYGEMPRGNGYIAVKKGSKWGYIDQSGKIIAPCVYDAVSTYGYYGCDDEELVSVKKGGKWGLINADGRLVVPFEYDDFWPYVDGLAGVWQGRKLGYIDAAGEIVIPIQYKAGKDFHDGFAPVQDNNGWHIIDTTGAIVGNIDFNVSDAYNFWNGLLAVKSSRDSKWGFVDQTGELVIPTIYSDVNNFFVEDAAWAKKGGKWGLIDNEGNELTEFVYDEAYWFLDGDTNGYAAVKQGKKMGYIGRDGKIVVPVEYDNVNGQIQQGFFTVLKDGKWGRLDETGQIVIPPKYEGNGFALGGLVNGISTFTLDGKRGIMDKNENVIIPNEYEAISAMSPNAIRAQKDKKWGLLDLEGNTLLPFDYDAITVYQSPVRIVVRKGYEDMFLLQKNKKWGVAIVTTAEEAANLAAPEESVLGAVTVTINGNIRNNPGKGSDAEVIGKAARNDTFDVVAWDVATGWYQIVWEDGLAWISPEIAAFAPIPVAE